MGRRLDAALSALARGLSGTLAGVAVVVLALSLAPGSAADLHGGPAASLDDALRAWASGAPTSWAVRPGAPLLPWLAEAARGSLLRLSSALLLLGALAILPWRRAALLGVLPTFLAAHLAIAGIEASTLAGLERGWWARPAWFPLPGEDHPFRDALAILLLAGSAGLWPAASQRVSAFWEHFATQPSVLATLGRGEAPAVGRAAALAAVEAMCALLPLALTTLILVEAALLLPGLGHLLWRAALARDLPLALGAALPLCASVGLTQTLRGVLAGWLLRPDAS